MKSLTRAVVVAALVAIPVASFAQSSQNQPVTRAQVRAELAQLEKAGYDPLSDNLNYPNNIQAAEARVHAQTAVAQADNSGYGAQIGGASQVGRPAAEERGPQSVFFGN